MRSDGGVWATSIDSVRLTNQPKKVNQSIETSKKKKKKRKKKANVLDRPMNVLTSRQT